MFKMKLLGQNKRMDSIRKRFNAKGFLYRMRIILGVCLSVFKIKVKRKVSFRLVEDSTCPSCGSKKNGKTTLTENSYACKKCGAWWANPVIKL